MQDSNTNLSDKALKDYLDIDFINLGDTVSTNTYAKELGLSGKCHKPTVIIANSQSGGRGRLGRSFYSEGGIGLYMSLLLFPKLPLSELQRITTAAAVAVCQAIEELCPSKPAIKWVNDIYLNGKKLAGILTEGSYDPETRSTKFAVVGIGINVFSPKNGFPEDLSNIATSLFPESSPRISHQYPFFRERLCAAIIRRFMPLYEDIKQSPHFKEYRDRLFIIGKNVDVIENDRIKPAKVIDLLPDFSLLVEYDDGNRKALISGEVSLKLNTKE